MGQDLHSWAAPTPQPLRGLWRRDPPHPHARQLTTTWGPALLSEGTCKLYHPHCLLLLEKAAPLPATAHTACLTSAVPGHQEPLRLGHGWGTGNRTLAPAAREPSLQKQAERSEEKRAPSAFLPTASSSLGGEEATRNWLFESAPQPIVRPRPLFLPCHGPGEGRRRGHGSAQPVLCTARPLRTHGSRGGPAKVAGQGGGACLSLFVHPCCSAGQGPGGHGKDKLCSPQLSRVMELKHHPVMARAATGTI